jgi:hypothetical protein
VSPSTLMASRTSRSTQGPRSAFRVSGPRYFPRPVTLAPGSFDVPARPWVDVVRSWLGHHYMGGVRHVRTRGDIRERSGEGR